MWCVAVAAGVVWDAEGAEAPSAERMLAEALEANRQLSELADGLIEDNALLREQVARLGERDEERDAELEKLRADFAVLQRMLFGRCRRSHGRGRRGGDGNADGGGRDRERRGAAGKKRGRGRGRGGGFARLPRLEVFWDFLMAGTAAGVRGAFTPLGDHLSGEQLDWQVIVRLAVHCRRRYGGPAIAGCPPR